MAHGTLDTPNAHERRLQKLEKQNAWMKAAIAILGLLFLINIVVARPRSFATVTASEFDLKDSTGAVRGKLAMLPDGPGIELYAASGEERATLVGGGENASLNLYIPATASPKAAAAVNLFNGTEQIASLSGSPVSSSLQIDSATGNVAGSFVVSDDFALLGLEGTRANTESLPVTASNVSCLTRSEAQGHKSAPLGAIVCLDWQGGPTIVLSREGKSLWSAPAASLSAPTRH
jgi:hypothetical protein